MIKQLKNLTILLSVLTSFSIFAAEPRWIDLKDKEGDVVNIDRHGTKVQVDKANTIGWGAQKMKVFYRVIFKNPIEVPNGGPQVDEERFEVNIGCSNLYKAYLIEKRWYLKDKYTHVFTYGEGRAVSTLITENMPIFYILESGCPEFDPEAVEDLDQMPFGTH